MLTASENPETPAEAATGQLADVGASCNGPYAFLTGLLMGAADVVPGVSGGTIALIMGVYERLLAAIRAFGLPLLTDLRRGRFRSAIGRVPWRFLLPLVAGILVSLVTLAHAIERLMETHPQLLFAFFFGLVAGSSLVLLAHQRWKPDRLVFLAVGVVLAYWFVGLVPADPGHSWPVLFASGALAVSAMILPGISGSFVLLVLGQYAYCVSALTRLTAALRSADLWAVTEVTWRVIVPAVAGGLTGLVLFSRLLHFLLRRYPARMLALLTGLMIGSLRRIWPYKQYLAWGTDRHGQPVPLRWRNTLPETFDTTVALAVSLALAGLALIIIVDRLRHRMRRGATTE